MGRSGGMNKRKLSQVRTRAHKGADLSWWNKWVKKNPYLIHITHSNAVDGIKANGIVPSDNTDQSPNSNWADTGNHSLSSRPGHSYFALPEKLDEIAEYYSDPCYLSGNDYIDEDEFREMFPEYNQLWVVVVETESLDPSLIAADEDCLNLDFEQSEVFPRDPEEINPEMEIEGWEDMSENEKDQAFEDMLDKMKTLGEWAHEDRADYLSDPKVIKEEAEERGTIAYGDRVGKIKKIIKLEEAREEFLKNK